jgi:hypothetical protein
MRPVRCCKRRIIRRCPPSLDWSCRRDRHHGDPRQPAHAGAGARPSLAHEKSCANNLRQVNLALLMYADDSADCYPLEWTEHNPHYDLLTQVEAYQPGLVTRCIVRRRDSPRFTPKTRPTPPRAEPIR